MDARRQRQLEYAAFLDQQIREKNMKDAASRERRRGGPEPSINSFPPLNANNMPPPAAGMRRGPPGGKENPVVGAQQKAAPPPPTFPSLPLGSDGTFSGAIIVAVRCTGSSLTLPFDFLLPLTCIISSFCILQLPLLSPLACEAASAAELSFFSSS